MGNSRNRPRLLATKLLAIREFLKLEHVEMATLLKAAVLSHTDRPYNIKPARISEYENGNREPNLLELIAYGRLGQVYLELIADDRFTVDELRKRLGKKRGSD